ncbi:GxxExxY protein [Wenzhouxiangella limi]|uniref:GxxExxY protein n=1 Tax=Wenzhouxiangella limi TaxID=2707351 RepID=A0A845UX61_9GAMM|nr:GxxExxY protein [Wenzhouxiangella limi]NDY94430.1 GxxExxY protein [Wenzhouxiangella limi]
MNADVNALTERVIGCVYAVSNGLGAGFLESVYENALALELAAAGICFQRQKSLRVYYAGEVVGQFAVDLLVEDCVLVELKAVRALLPEHQAQLINYLKAARLSVGLLVNFGTPKAQIKRMVHQL